MLYFVSYTLRPPRVNKELLNELMQFPDWWHYLDYTWLIATTETADELYNRLAEHLHDTDFIVILEIRGDFTYQGWLPQGAWDWISQRGAQWLR